MIYTQWATRAYSQWLTTQNFLTFCTFYWQVEGKCRDKKKKDLFALQISRHSIWDRGFLTRKLLFEHVRKSCTKPYKNSKTSFYIFLSKWIIKEPNLNRNNQLNCNYRFSNETAFKMIQKRVYFVPNNDQNHTKSYLKSWKMFLK